MVGDHGTVLATGVAAAASVGEGAEDCELAGVLLSSVGGRRCKLGEEGGESVKARGGSGAGMMPEYGWGWQKERGKGEAEIRKGKQRQQQETSVKEESKEGAKEGSDRALPTCTKGKQPITDAVVSLFDWILWLV